MIKKLFIFIFIIVYSNGLFIQNEVALLSVNDDKAVVNIGNLKVGQSGVIVHEYNNNQKIIISNAIVLDSNKNFSTIKLNSFDLLKNDSLPTTNLKPTKGDIFILNHLYSKSLLITPNSSSYKIAQRSFQTKTFINIDMFASNLKINNNPRPNKHDFISFCLKNNLGLIYFVIKQNVYVVDVNSFKIVDQAEISYEENKIQKPFYSRTKNIKAGTFSWLKSNDIGDYVSYYSKLIGLEDDR